MKSFLIFILKLLITLSLVWFTIDSMGSAKSGVKGKALLDVLFAAEGLLIFLFVVLYLISILLQAMQWQWLLQKQSIQYSYLKTLRIFWVGLFFNNFMPGNVGGDVKKIYDVSKDSNKVAGSFAATLSDRIFGLFTINLISLLVCSYLSFFYSELTDLLLPTFGLFVLMSIFFISLYSRRVASLILKAIRWKKLSFISDKFAALQTSFQEYHNPFFWAKILCVSLGIQSSRILGFYLLAMSIGVEIPLVYFFCFIPLIGIVSALPISIGGFGPREFLAQSLFARIGVVTLHSVAIQELAWALAMFVSLLGGIEFLISKKAKTKLLEG